MLDDLAHVLSHFEHSHVQARVLLFVLVEEGLEVLVHRVQESVHLLKTRLGQCLNLTDSVVDHGSKLLTFVGILLGGQVKLVKNDLTHLDDLLVGQFEVLVSYWHSEVRINEVLQSIHILICNDGWQLSGIESCSMR